MTEQTEATEKAPAKTRATTPKPTYTTPHVHTAILEILKTLGVEKNGTLPSNMGGNKYIAAVDVAKEIKQKFSEMGIISLPVEREIRKEIVQANNRITVTTSVEAQYTLISTQDGSSVVIQGVGDGVAQGSAVASNIASTNAFKNAFLRAFLITEQSVEEYAKAGPAEVAEPRAVAAQRSGGNNPASGAAVSSDVAEINALKKELTAFVPQGESAPKWLSSQAEAHLPAKDDGTWDGWDRNVNALTALRDALKKQAG